MKRVRCPKCDNYIQFDETKYQEGQSLVFVCDQCKKQFSIRIGKSKLSAGTRKEEIIDEKEGTQDWGNVVAIENVFGYKQVLPLHEGDNLIGRRSKGTEVDIPIETNDPSMDRRHFVMNDLLGPKDRIRLEDGNVFTLGATTLILRTAKSDSEE